jgi:hypothetical protein
MDISALVNIVMGRDAALLPGAAPEAGERLPVRVLEVRDDGKVLVDCGRFRAVAEVTFPVSAGDEFTVRVLGTQGTLRLEVVKPSPPAGPGLSADPLPAEAAPAVPAPLLRDAQVQAGRLLAVLPQTPMPEDPAGLQAAVARITELLRPLEPGQGPGVPDRIQDLCHNSGLFLESRLQDELARDPAQLATARPADSAAVRRILAADLKAQLSALVHDLESGTPATNAARESSEMLRAARALLSEIVQQQAEITRTTDESRQMTLIHFSLPLNTPQGAARIKVGFPRRKRRERSGGYRAALLVELDRLGSVRADLQLAEGLLAADLFVGKAELKALVEEHLSELRSGLAPLFEAVRVSVRVSEKKIADFEWEDLRPALAGRLDVRA